MICGRTWMYSFGIIAIAALWTPLGGPGHARAGQAAAQTAGSSTHLAPAALASSPTKGNDPVYDAWEEFLKQRGKSAEGGQVLVARDGTDSSVSGLKKGGLPEGTFGSLLATVFGGVGLAGLYVARKKVPNLSGWIATRAVGKKEKTKVKVLSVSPLSNQGSVAVVEVLDEVLVLGVTSDRVSLLTRLDAERNEVKASLPVEEEKVSNTSSIAPEFRRPTRSRAKTKAQTTQDFGALLGNLVQSREATLPESQSPIARYAAMAQVSSDSAFEPPPEDMAGQVLRKMRTMRRFRNQS